MGAGKKGDRAVEDGDIFPVLDLLKRIIFNVTFRRLRRLNEATADLPTACAVGYEHIVDFVD